MKSVRYRNIFCRQCVEAGDAGYSLTAFAGMLGVSRETLDRWAERHARFAEAMGIHQAKRAKFWEDELVRIATNGGKTGATTMVMFALKSVAAEDYGLALEPAVYHPGEHVLSDDSAEKLKDILE